MVDDCHGSSVVDLLWDLREAIPNKDILLYVDDRSWASESAQDCVDFLQEMENMEFSTCPQGKRVQGEILSRGPRGGSERLRCGWCPGKLTTTSRFWKLGSRREKEEYSQPRRQLVWKVRERLQSNVNVYRVRPPGIC